MKRAPTRRERLFLAVLALYLIGHLVARPDLFPFSTFPMFSDRTESMSWLTVAGADGPIDPAALDLATDYVVNPDPRYGIRVPGPNPGGRPADPEDVAARVERRLPELDQPWVVVTEITVEQLANGTIRRRTTGTWRFER